MEAVIFDMDGVLIDSEPIHRVVEESLFREHRIPVTPDEHDGYLGTSSIDMFRAIAAAHPGPWKNAGLTIEEWIALEQERYGRELFSGRVPFVPGALETVRTLAREGWKIAVASSAPRRQIEFVAERGGISGFAECLRGAEDVRRSKPSPDLFLATADCLGVEPSRCWVVEDSPNGVAAAKAAGMKWIEFVGITMGEIVPVISPTLKSDHGSL